MFNVHKIIKYFLVTKFLKLKYPIAAAIFVTIGFDFAFHMYADVPQGHWNDKISSNQIFIYT